MDLLRVHSYLLQYRRRCYVHLHKPHLETSDPRSLCFAYQRRFWRLHGCQSIDHRPLQCHLFTGNYGELHDYDERPRLQSGELRDQDHYHFALLLGLHIDIRPVRVARIEKLDCEHEHNYAEASTVGNPDLSNVPASCNSALGLHRHHLIQSIDSLLSLEYLLAGCNLLLVLVLLQESSHGTLCRD